MRLPWANATYRPVTYLTEKAKPGPAQYTTVERVYRRLSKGTPQHLLAYEAQIRGVPVEAYVSGLASWQEPGAVTPREIASVAYIVDRYEQAPRRRWVPPAGARVVMRKRSFLERIVGFFR